MVYILVLMLALLTGCAFHVPTQQTAREQCMEYVAEIDRKSAECMDPPNMLPDHAGNVAHCDKVVAVNPLDSVDRCIADFQKLACAARANAGWCAALLEE